MAAATTAISRAWLVETWVARADLEVRVAVTLERSAVVALEVHLVGVAMMAELAVMPGRAVAAGEATVELAVG